MTQQRLAGIQIARIDQDHARIVEQGEPNDERRYPTGPVDTANVEPVNRALADGKMMRMKLYGGPRGNVKENRAAQDEQRAGNEAGRSAQPEPSGECG